MNAYVAEPSFKSARSADAEAGVVVAPFTDAIEAGQDVSSPMATTTVLMVSTSPIVLEHFARMAASSADSVVTTRCTTLSDLLASGGIDAFDHDIVVFEAVPGDTDQLDALRLIADERAGKTRFLVLSDDNLSLSHARALSNAGVEEVLPLSTILPAPTARASVAVAEPKGHSSADGVVFVITKARGGVGATTTAVNLAHALQFEAKHRKGTPPKRVALVDLDVQNGAVGAFLDVEDTGSFIELLRNGDIPDATFVRRAMIPHDSGISVLPAPSDFAPIDALTVPMVEALIAELRARFDYVVVDMPAAILPSAPAVLSTANQILLVTDSAVPSIRQASRLLSFLTEDNFTLPVEIVVTHEAKPFRMSPSLKEASAVLGRPFTHWIPRDDKTARRAIDLGKPAEKIAARSAMTKAYRRLADDLVAAQTAIKGKEK